MLGRLLVGGVHLVCIVSATAETADVVASTEPGWYVWPAKFTVSEMSPVSLIISGASSARSPCFWLMFQVMPRPRASPAPAPTSPRNSP